MKKYKALSRVYLLAYLVALFGGMLFGLLLVKDNLGLAIAMMVLCLLDFAAIIVSRAMFRNHYHIFFYVSLPAFIVLTLLVIAGFSLEVIYSNQGLSATYAWTIGSLNLGLVVFIDLFYALTIRKIHHKRLVAEGIIVEDDEI